jgi:hypothetical protein
MSGLFVYRSKLFGGLSAEVLTIFNQSNIMNLLKGKKFRLWRRFGQFDFLDAQSIS